MIVSGGKVLAIDHVEVDNVTITGDGVFSKKCKDGKPLGLAPGVISGISAATYSAVSGQVNKQIDKKLSATSATLEKHINDVNSKVTELSSQFTAFKKETNETFDDFEDWSKTVDTSITGLDERVTALENRPAGGGSACLTKDIFVTNSVGSIKSFITIPSGTPLENIWTSALKVEYVPSAGNVSTNLSSSLYAYPTTQTLNNLYFNVSAGNDTITAYSFKIGNGETSNGTTNIPGVDAEGIHSAKLTSATNVSINSPTTIYASAFDGVTAPVTNKITINFCWPYFYGQSTNSAVDISTLTKLIQTSGNKTCEYKDYSLNYIIFAFDSSYKDIKEFIDKSGFPVTSGFTKTTAEYAGHTYKVYVSDEQKVYSGNYTFIHG